MTALMRAYQEGHLDVVHVLLAHGADGNAKDNEEGVTPLILASKPPKTATSMWCRRFSPMGPTSMPRETTAGPLDRTASGLPQQPPRCGKGASR
jgi:Ankyrin repeats (many copies)